MTEPTAFLAVVTMVFCKAPTVRLSDERRVLGSLEVKREDFLCEQRRLDDVESRARRCPQEDVGIILA